MNRPILVPTDFSACAKYAYDAAIQLATRLQTEVILCHHLPFIPKGNHSFASLKGRLMEEDVQQLKNAQVLMEALVESTSVPVKMVFLGGKFVEAIKELVVESKVELIVMGSHGTSGKREYFIGSNTQRVVREVHCYTLVVKNPVKKLNFEHVVFASDFNEHDKPLFVQFLQFIRSFNTTIHLVHVNNNPFWGLPYGFVKEAMEEYGALCDSIPYQLHYFKGANIEGGIRQISEQLGADLIVISNQQRRPLKRMLSGSNVEFLVNHANIPVLSLDTVQQKKKEEFVHPKLM